MINLEQFLEQLATPAFIGIVLLMFSAFILGYFLGAHGMKATKKAKITALKKEVNSLKITAKAKDIETIFTEIKPKIIEVVKEQQVKLESPSKAQKEKKEIPVAIVSKTRSNYVNYSVNSPSLDFKNFGFGDKDNKDMLTQIDGIGPYIEEKLNEIGIYNFDQISKLEIKDIRILTTLIDFFPGRIERDDWVGQAKALNLIKQ